MIGLVLSLLLAAAPVVLLTLLVRRVTRPGGGAVDGGSVRRFFQYSVLYGLVLVATSGVTGLLALATGPRPTVADEDAQLAGALTFTLLGLPILGAVVLWSRSVHRREPEERSTPGWAVYATVTALTALVMAMAELYEVVGGAVEGRTEVAAGLTLVVWGGTWSLHVRLLRSTVPPHLARPHLAAGSLIGLGTLLVGVTGVIAEAGRLLLLESGEGTPASTVDGGPFALAVAGALVWWRYWLRGDRRARPDALWLVHVLLLGMGASLVMAVVGASLASYTALVWFVGDPAWTSVRHFTGTPAAVGAAVAGGSSWWYHRQVLGGAAHPRRTEVDRVHDYLMAGIALSATAAGIVVLVVAGITSLLPAAVVERGGSAVNGALAAATLLLVGGPLWWVFWRRVRRATTAAVARELSSPVRRVYLLVLVGLSGVAAVVAVLVAGYAAVQGLLSGRMDAGTLHDVRVPLGVLVAAAAVAGYHGRTYREDRRTAPRIGAATHRGPRYVLLIGAPDDGVVAAVRRATRGEVRLLVRTDEPARPWVPDEVVAVVAVDPHPALAVIGAGEGLTTIPLTLAGR
jgi:hypothetical protein